MRRAKVFGPGWSVPLDRNAKSRIMHRVGVINARHRRPRQRLGYGPITEDFTLVLAALLDGHHNAATGRCYPSHATIARTAGVHRDTVNEAIKELELRGIATWEHRLVRRTCLQTDALTGRMVRVARVLRTSNAYRFFDPAAPSQIPAQTPCLKSLSTAPVQIAPPVDPASPLERALARLGRAIAMR